MKEISWWRTSFGERESRQIANAIAHEHISQGALTAEFERNLAEVLKVPYAVATTSGSSALLLALLAADVGPGDEVILPNRTWIATAHAVALLGAQVVLVDTQTDLPIMDASQLEEKITIRTKAIIPVHLNGRSVAMREVRDIASRNGVAVIEDAAQAFGSRNAEGLLGTQSDMGCFSLSVAKIISTGQGGFLVTKDHETYEKLKLLRGHGVNDVLNASYTRLGFNFRFTDIQAAIGMVQLTRLKDRIEKVKAIYSLYATAIKEFGFLRFIPVNIDGGEIPIYIEVLSRQRDRLMQHLSKYGIQTRPFYPNVNHANYLNCAGDFPRSDVFEQEGLFLPGGPEQPLTNVDRVIEALRQYEEKN